MNGPRNMPVVPFDLLTHIYKDNVLVARRRLVLVTKRLTHLRRIPFRHLLASLPHNFAGCLTHIKSPLIVMMLTMLINLLGFNSKQRLPAHFLLVKDDCWGYIGANNLLVHSKKITG